MSVLSRRKQGELGGLSDRTSDIILIVFSLVILLIVAYPLYYVLIASLSDPYDVYAGKNNTQNEYLTLKTASRGDWFFHVKGAPGSHVILVQRDEEPPAEDFTDAAEIAAYYSSKRGGENIEVDYTEVKYVKKPAGSPPGFVIYSRNYSAVVSPDERKIEKMRAKQ